MYIVSSAHLPDKLMVLAAHLVVLVSENLLLFTKADAKAQGEAT